MSPYPHPRVRLLSGALCLAVVLCPALAQHAAAQRKNPQLDRRTQDSGQQGPSRYIPLKNGRRTPCGTDGCLKVPLDDLGVDNGLQFGFVPAKTSTLYGTLCKCGSPCADADWWPDANPLSTTGWSIVKINERPSLLSRLRDRDNEVWFIRWRDRPFSSFHWDSWALQVSAAPPGSPLFANDTVLQCERVRPR